MDSINIALVQGDPVVGDIDGNVALALAAWTDARDKGADLVVFSELFIVGYPPEDLVLKPVFIRRAMAAAECLANQTVDGPGIIVGCPWTVNGQVGNAALLLDGGKVQAVRFKHHLPNYGVFDEKRVFVPGPLPEPVDFRGLLLGLPICEDIWMSDVCRHLKVRGARILIALNGSPFEADKVDQRVDVASARVRETGLPLIYVNQCGGQDELVFDGTSFVMAALGDEFCGPSCEFRNPVNVRFPSWKEHVEITRWTLFADTWTCAAGTVVPQAGHEESVYQAMVLGLRDYIKKNRFPGVVIGLSGGVDSALTAAVAVDALGPDHVHCIMLPYQYTSSVSLEEAAETAKLLGVRYDVVPIGPAVEALGGMLSGLFTGRKPDITEENIQARVRGVVLMAVSNKFGGMVLTTGNKSESSTGYATIYGDMCGGYSVLKDVYKTEVFALCHWRNANWPSGALGPNGRIIPERTITRPPSAELRPDQKDQDSLPPYAQLDEILESLVEGEKSWDEISAGGHDPAMVARIENLLYTSEYKRRQGAPGVKITSRNFGRDRRYPITNRFRDMRRKG
jgi:NAD+ synthase